VLTERAWQVDALYPDLALHPRFAEAQECDVIIGPGDALYLPPRYWHYVRSLSTSMSVSFWWSTRGNEAERGSPTEALCLN
jgi:ribosomal protein L16 Arg81 hydroxylase